MTLFRNNLNNEEPDSSGYTSFVRKETERAKRRFDLLSPNQGFKEWKYVQTPTDRLKHKILYTCFISTSLVLLSIILSRNIAFNGQRLITIISAVCYLSTLYLFFLLFQQLTVKDEMTALKKRLASVQFRVCAFLCATLCLACVAAFAIILLTGKIAFMITDILASVGILVCGGLFFSVFIIEQKRKIQYIINESYFQNYKNHE